MKQTQIPASGCFDIKRIALGNYHYVRYSFGYFLNSVLRLGERYGVDKIELWAAAPHFSLDDMDASLIAAVKKAVTSGGLSIVCLTPEQCVYPVNLAAEEETTRLRSIEYFKKAIFAASELESPYVLVTAGCGYFDKPVSDARKRSVDSISLLAEYAARQGTALVYEPLSVYSSNIVNGLQDLSVMINDLRSDSVFAMLDLGQAALLNEKPEDYVAVFADRLRHIHLMDATPQGHLALGDGNLPLAASLAALEKGGYNHIYSFEFTDIRYRHEPEKADERSLEWLKNTVFQTPFQ